MTKNIDGENLTCRVAAMVAECEQSQDPESTYIGQEFQRLQEVTKIHNDTQNCSEGAKPINRSKNRYRDVLPYDDHRVILPSDNDSNYINASFVKDLSGFRRYIAAQGPIDTTTEDFFHMIWTFEIESIVCTAIDNEAGRMKFRRYWPDDTEEFFKFGSYQITNDSLSDKAYSCDDYEIRPLIINRGENQRSVLLYRFLHWLDHDVPDNESHVLELLLRMYENQNASIGSPILIHCSAGCGRTGSLIAIDLCRLLFNDEGLFHAKEYQLNPVFQIVSHIRQFRVGLIQTLKQYLFVYKMFLFIMNMHGDILLRSILHSNDKQTEESTVTTQLSTSSIVKSTFRRQSGSFQIILRDPPIRRRLLDDSKVSSQVVSLPKTCPSSSSSSKSLSMIETLQTSEQSSVSYRSSIVITIKSRHTNDSINSDESSLQKRHEEFLNKLSRRHYLSLQRHTRSDSADFYSASVPQCYHNKKHSSEQKAYSD